MNFFKILALVSLLTAWLEEATEDGEITIDEVTELITKAVAQLGLSSELKIKL